MDQNSEPRNLHLPPNFSEVTRNDKTIHLTREELPWLPEDSEIPLVDVVTDDKFHFLLGSAIRHPKLMKYAGMLGARGAEIDAQANRTFYAQIQELVVNSNVDCPMLQHPRSKEHIYYTKGGKDTRVYFIRRKVDDEDAIIKIAVCHKKEEQKVLRIIAYT